MRKKIFITGSSGFIGTYLKGYFKHKYSFIEYNRNAELSISEEVILHLAAKAHDLKNVTKPSEYYLVNTDLTKIIFDEFIKSTAKVFIYFSSVKAAADVLDSELTEEKIPSPITHYGISKLKAEQYILSYYIPEGKRVYILRPCMIHGPGNKGNLNLLNQIVMKGFPWPLGSFNNKRSFCSIDNLCFILNELIENNKIPSGIYNIADDIPLSTNELIKLISINQGRKASICYIPSFLIKLIAILGDLLRLPLNSERLKKLTESYVVSNNKIKNAITKPLPLNSKDGLMKTLNSFNNYA